jgi:lysozyme family protein
MADFTQAVQVTLQHEGGYVDNPVDPGGATNMGIEQRDMPNTPIRDLTVDQAKIYYQETYWKPFYSLITSQAVASKLFDMGVLFGVGTAIKNLQAALDVAMDDVFGPETLSAVNAAAPGSLLVKFQAELNAHVRAIVAGNPKLSVFQHGWQNRINS